MKPKPAYSTLERKIRRLNTDLAAYDRVIDAGIDFEIKLLRQLNRTQSLLQAFKDKEIDRAHRLIRKNP